MLILIVQCIGEVPATYVYADLFHDAYNIMHTLMEVHVNYDAISCVLIALVRRYVQLNSE